MRRAKMVLELGDVCKVKRAEPVGVVVALEEVLQVLELGGDVCGGLLVDIRVNVVRAVIVAGYECRKRVVSGVGG